MSSVTITHKVSDVQDHVERQFGDESGVQVTQADIIRWVNLGQDEIFRRNKPVKKTATADLVASQYTYTFPDDVMTVERLRINGKTIKPMSFQDADEYINSTDPNNENSGLPQVWYEFGGSFTLWPVPNVNQAGGIVIFYSAAPTPVTVLTDSLSVPDVYYSRLLEYVLSQAYEMDENLEAAQLKGNQFLTGLDNQSQESSAAASTYPVITVLWEDM